MASELPDVGLSDIAAGLEVTHEQRDRGVATVDDTDVDLRERLEPHADRLPCDPESAATVLETYADGGPVGATGHEAGVAPVTAAKTLHLLGIDGVSPLSPTAREVCRDWLSGRIGHAEARELTGASETEFALAAFVEAHDPIEGLEGLLERVLTDDAPATVRKRDHLAETMSDVDDLL